MAKNDLRAGTSPFAHLLALVTGNPVGGKKADDDKPENEDPDAETDPEDPDAETDKPDEGAEGDEPAEPEKGKRGKKAKAEDDDSDESAESDDDDEDMAKARHEGWLAGQARCRKIFSAKSAGVRPDMAAHLAFDQTIPSAQAIAMLDMAAAGNAPVQGSRLANRMARVVIPNPGAGGSGRKAEDMSFGERAKAAAKKAGII
ncbi:MAG: hypothetical protein JWO63_81 [Frankiales bacterium]|nr:hypothetical protein [Frankiales bacterium]